MAKEGKGKKRTREKGRILEKKKDISKPKKVGEERRGKTDVGYLLLHGLSTLEKNVFLRSLHTEEDIRKESRNNPHQHIAKNS